MLKLLLDAEKKEAVSILFKFVVLQSVHSASLSETETCAENMNSL